MSVIDNKNVDEEDIKRSKKSIAEHRINTKSSLL